MILQEEAMNLLTRKIGETEEALKKKTEEQENLQRENEVLEKEIFRLKSVMAASGTAKEHPIGENLQKPGKFKSEALACHRPYRLIKELKAKLEEQEKSLCTWKSKQVFWVFRPKAGREPNFSLLNLFFQNHILFYNFILYFAILGANFAPPPQF